MNPHYSSEILSDYLHRALSPAADSAVLTHLDVCGDCRRRFDDEAAIGDALRAAARADEREFPSMVKARVWDAVRRERPTLLDRLHSRWATALAVPVAAMVALAVYFGTPILQSAGPPTVSASYYLDEHNAQTTQSPLGPSVSPAVYTTDGTGSATAASYIDTADAATLDDAAGAGR
jgi:predicted anti-sigma-YlaC factor YlaD